jgi:alkanesulfonate monooxygenase SsuD/methylene tetrahydromethanopterin reductase-like flavin-dependent oxidoreductase (luciferase family)
MSNLSLCAEGFSTVAELAQGLFTGSPPAQQSIDKIKEIQKRFEALAEKKRLEALVADAEQELLDAETELDSLVEPNFWTVLRDPDARKAFEAELDARSEAFGFALEKAGKAKANLRSFLKTNQNLIY